MKKDANLLTDAILHLPELRYFSRQVVGAHVGLPDIVRTYETYTLECSRQIETDMQDLVNGVFPLYARWKLSNPTRQYERHGNTSWHAGAMSAVDDVLKERYEKAVKSPDWAVGRGGIGSHMDIVTKSYLSWHALRAISEVNTALSTLRGELADLPRKRRFSIYSSEQEASEMRQGIVFLENVLKELSVVRAAHDQSAVAGTPAAGKGIKMPNFVQILCGDRILERLRETHMKPFFDKLQAVYDADRQIGRVQEGVVKIPSATYVKIALGQPDGTPLYT